MKPEDIINSLGDISDDILLQAETPIRRRSHRKFITVLASAVLLICAFTIPLAMQQGNAPEPTDIPSNVINTLEKAPLTPPDIPADDNSAENESYITDESPSDFSEHSTDTDTSSPDTETSDTTFPEEPPVKPICPDAPIYPGDIGTSSPEKPVPEIPTPPDEGDTSEPENDDPEQPPCSDNCLDIYGKMDIIESVPDSETNFIKTLSPADSETLLSLVDLIAVPENAAILEGVNDSTVEGDTSIPDSFDTFITIKERIYLLGFDTEYQYCISSMDTEIYIYSSRLGGKDYLLQNGDSLYCLPLDEFVVIEYVIWGTD